jgi:hypothetical protein
MLLKPLLRAAPDSAARLPRDHEDAPVSALSAEETVASAPTRN